ncbi:MAG: DUF4097 family beta strand repeat protein [Acidobacteria bacterium]|nr:DUF4097 family beta strand repeat protein [Acidobacteriota bacterium]
MSAFNPRTSTRKIILLALMVWVAFAAQTIFVSAQSLNKTLVVSSDSPEIEVINQTGSIKVSASTAGAGRVVINSRQPDSTGRVNVTQGSDGRIKVEVTGRSPIDFEITAPAAANLDLLIYKGAISITNATGTIKARVTTDGNIMLAGLRSNKIDAHSSNGGISFSGDLIPGGEYSLRAFSGRIDATFPSAADFKLTASSFSGVIDLGGFPMKFERQTNQLVEASCGTGRAKVSLWTQEGSIYLHRKP